MKTLEQLQQDWGNSTCGKEPEQYIYDYMKNQVLAERERIKEKLRKDWEPIMEGSAYFEKKLGQLIDTL